MRFFKQKFINKFFTDLKLIKQKPTIVPTSSSIKEISSFFFIKILLNAFNLTPKTIEAEITNKTKTSLITKSFFFCYKIILLIFINILTICLKIQKYIFYIFIFIVILLSCFLLLKHYPHTFASSLLKEYRIPNTSQLLLHILPNTVSQSIINIIELLCVTYIFPIASFCMFYLIYWLYFELSEAFDDQDSFCETALLFLLQIYTKNFVEDTQEEIINTYIPIENTYHIEWDNVIFMWLATFMLLTPKLWAIDTHHYWPYLRKRNPSQFEDSFFLRHLSNFDRGKKDPNMLFYKPFVTLESHDGEDYEDNYFFNLTELYNDYLKIIFFKIHPLLETLIPYLYFFFFCIFFFFMVLNLIIEPYFKFITTFFFENFTYKIYRPFLDQYFYTWYRLMINIPKTKNQTLLIKDPILSQYLDIFKFLPDLDHENESFFENIFSTDFYYYPVLTTIEEAAIEESDPVEILHPLSPQKTQETNFLFILLISILVIESTRQNPLFFSKYLHENLYLFTPLTSIKTYNWLFQYQQISPIYNYLNWPGWDFFFPKLPLLFSLSKSIETTTIIIEKYKHNKYHLMTQYFHLFYTKFPIDIITNITKTQKLKGYFIKKKNSIKSTIIWFSKGTVEFFLRTTILPKFRFKKLQPYKYPFIYFIRYQKQKTLYDLRKTTFQQFLKNYLKKK